MSSKLTSFLFIAALLLLFFALPPSAAARPHPSFSDVTPLNSTDQTENVEAEKVEEKCEGSVGEEECLMRRTLAAHVDYIYTQSQNNNP